MKCRDSKKEQYNILKNNFEKYQCVILFSISGCELFIIQNKNLKFCGFKVFSFLIKTE